MVKIKKNCFLFRQNGFSLIELLMSAVMLMLVTYIMMPKDTSELILNFHLDAATKDLASQLRYAQSLAKTTGLRHGIKIGNPKEYVIFQCDKFNVCSTINSPHDQKPMSFDFTTLHPSIEFVFNAYPVELSFKPGVGAPGVGEGLVIKLKNGLAIEKEVTVTEITGRIEIKDL